jgi:GntR family transcriptional regulator
MPHAFILSQTDGRPIYLQLMEQIKQRIAVGDWKAGESIPSIRQLAADLQISVITVKRAYLELERGGVITTQHGKGSVVADRAELRSQIYEDDLARHVDEAARLAALLGLGTRELQRRVRDAVDRLAGIEPVRR